MLRLTPSHVSFSQSETNLDESMLLCQAGTADDYSDLDLYVIVDDQNYDTFFAERRAFLGRLGEPVFFEDFGFDMVGFISYPADLEAVVIDKLERWGALHLDH